MSEQMLELADRLAGSLQPFNFLTRDERDLIIAALRSSAVSAPVSPIKDLLACTVSCSGTEITIQCDNHDVKERLMDFLTGCFGEPDGALSRSEPQTAPGASEGHGEPCYYCGEPCNSFAGNPGLWPVALCHANDPGRVKWHHTGCVSERLDVAHSQAGIEQRHMAQLLTILDVMKSAHSKEPGRLMSIWPHDIEAVEAAVAALTRPERGEGG